MRGSSVRGERDSGGDRDNVPRRQPTMHLRDSHTVPSILETRTLNQSDMHYRDSNTEYLPSCISETHTLLYTMHPRDLCVQPTMQIVRFL